MKRLLNQTALLLTLCVGLQIGKIVNAATFQAVVFSPYFSTSDCSDTPSLLHPTEDTASAASVYKIDKCYIQKSSYGAHRYRYDQASGQVYEVLYQDLYCEVPDGFNAEFLIPFFDSSDPCQERFDHPGFYSKRVVATLSDSDVIEMGFWRVDDLNINSSVCWPEAAFAEVLDTPFCCRINVVDVPVGNCIQYPFFPDGPKSVRLSSTAATMFDGIECLGPGTVVTNDCLKTSTSSDTIRRFGDLSIPAQPVPDPSVRTETFKAVVTSMYYSTSDCSDTPLLLHPTITSALPAKAYRIDKCYIRKSSFTGAFKYQFTEATGEVFLVNYDDIYCLEPAGGVETLILLFGPDDPCVERIDHPTFYEKRAVITLGDDEIIETGFWNYDSLANGSSSTCWPEAALSTITSQTCCPVQVYETAVGSCVRLSTQVGSKSLRLTGVSATFYDNPVCFGPGVDATDQCFPTLSASTIRYGNLSLPPPPPPPPTTPEPTSSPISPVAPATAAPASNAQGLANELGMAITICVILGYLVGE